MGPPQSPSQLLESPSVKATRPGLADAELLARVFQRFALEIRPANKSAGVIGQLVNGLAERLLELVVEQTFQRHFGLLVGDFRALPAFLPCLAEKKDHCELAARSAEPRYVVG